MCSNTRFYYIPINVLLFIYRFSNIYGWKGDTNCKHYYNKNGII